MITSNIKRLLTLILPFTLSLAISANAQFKHPGVAHDQQSIDFVKKKIEAKEEPWLTAWQKLKATTHASLEWQPIPHAHVERGPYNEPNIGSSDFSDDAKAAYIHALCWALSGEKAHIEKSAEILNAWSAKLKTIKNHDARLLIGMSGHHFCIAAELTKHTWDGWEAEKQADFAKLLRTLFYPLVKDLYPSANGNWDGSMLQTIMAMGVFLDDQVMFDEAKNYFLAGKGNGAIGNYFKPSGQCQESGRDQAHTQMGLEFLANTCETAWLQGVDLYGALDNRLLKGFEYTAKYNLGKEVPYETYVSFEGRYKYKNISDDSRGRYRAMYERVYNHYHNRKGLDAPNTIEVAMQIREGKEKRKRRRRPSRSYSRAFYHLDTLMYANQPASFK